MGKSSSSRCCRGNRDVPKCAGTQHPRYPHLARAQPLTLAHASFFFTVSFSGSTFKANLRFRTVHSWPQNTFCKASRDDPAPWCPTHPHPATTPAPGWALPPEGPRPRTPPDFGVPPQAGAETWHTHRLLGQSPQGLSEVGEHLLRRPLKELPTASHKQGVTCGERGLGMDGTPDPLSGFTL